MKKYMINIKDYEICINNTESIITITKDRLQNKIYIGKYFIVHSKNIGNILILANTNEFKNIGFNECFITSPCGGIEIEDYKLKNNFIYFKAKRIQADTNYFKIKRK